MMRLAERLGVSLRSLLRDYTKNEIDLWIVYFSKEPSEGERIELAVARLCALFKKAHSEKGTKVDISDYLFKADWNPLQDDLELFRKTLKIK